MNTIIRIDRDKFRQVKFNINLFQIKNRKATVAVSKHDSIFQECNLRILSQNNITNEFITKRYQVYINKGTGTDISKDEKYVSSIISIERLRFEEKNIRENKRFRQSNKRMFMSRLQTKSCIILFEEVELG